MKSFLNLYQKVASGSCLLKTPDPLARMPKCKITENVTENRT